MSGNGAEGELRTVSGYMTHEHTQFILWGLIADWFILIGRYKLLSKRNWYNIHPAAMIVVTVVSLLYRENHNHYRVNIPSFTLQWLVQIHKVLSVPSLFINLISNLVGFVLRFLLTYTKNPFKDTRINITNLRRLHMIGGISLWVNIRLSLLTGSYIFSHSYDSSMLLIVLLETIIFLLYAFYLEKRYRSSFDGGRVILSSHGIRYKYEEGADTILAAINNRALNHHQLKEMFKDKRVFIFLNNVFSIGDEFVHPGGHWILEKANFTDITRYLMGVIGLETEGGAQRWTHTSAAFEELRHNCIGSINKIDSSSHKEWIISDLEGRVVFSKDLWKLADIISLSPSTSMFKFKNVSYRLKLGTQGIRWMGKFYVIHGKGGVQRLYSSCSSIAHEFVYFMMGVKDFCEGFQLDNPASQIFPVNPEYIDYLPLVIKMYDRPGALSKEIHLSSPNEVYLIEGPFGRGYEFDHSFKGQIVLVVGGTGMLPFLDLISSLYMKALILSFSSRYLDLENNEYLKTKESYKDFMPFAKFKLLGSFTSIDDFHMRAVVEDLYKVCQENHFDFFDCEIRLSEDKNLLLPTTKRRYDADYLAFHVQRSTELVIICGSPEMNASVYKSLVEDEKFPRERVVFQ